MWKMCNKKFNPWWVEDGGHNDIDTKFRKNYYFKLYEFIKFVHELINNKTEREVLSIMRAEPWDKHIETPHIYRKYFVEIEDR